MFLIRLLKRLLKLVLYLIIIVILIPIVGLAYGWLTTEPLDATPLPGVDDAAPPAELAATIRTAIPGYQRPEEATFLTYPEWAIVYHAREYAAFVKDNRESGFSYWAYIGRFWQDYAMVIRASADYPFNFSNHQMLVVIGTSHTIENAIQWGYENTIGRLTEWTSGKKTAVDRYQANVATEYAAFLDQVPWYQFPYAKKRARLFAVVPDAGDDPVRTTERKWAFGAADSIKQGYADLIKLALAATADPAFLDIHVWAKGPVAASIRPEKDTFLERDMGAEGAVFVTRRYQVFTDMIPRLIERGVTFVEIGGNDEILLTVLSPAAVTAPEGSRTLFSYELPAEPGKFRTGLIAAVRRLDTVLPALKSSGATLEHVYDY
jgi:hypothetical protein